MESDNRPVAYGRWRGRRRARSECSDHDARGKEQWAPKWRRLLSDDGVPPTDFEEFDCTVRGMLNRISTENAKQLLPLDPSLRGAEWRESDGDCPSWWAYRFSALMLNSYLQVLHTNRSSRGLAVRSNDNVLPKYLDAVAPLLIQSPRLVAALVSWFSCLLHFRDLSWSITRLLLLASRVDENPVALPSHALGRLPGELVKKRILTFLVPSDPPFAWGLNGSLSSFWSTWSAADKQKDVVGVLAHLLNFSPSAAWPQLSALGFALAEAGIASILAGSGEDHVYLAATILVTIAQRLYPSMSTRVQPTADLAALTRLTLLLKDAVDERRQNHGPFSAFVNERILVALKHAQRAQDRFS